MTTEMTTLHRTSPLAWRFTTCTPTSTFTECTCTHCLICIVHFIHTRIGSRSSLDRTPLTTIHMSSMCAVSSPWSPLSTSLSSCRPCSSSFSSSSSTRSSWQTCTTPLRWCGHYWRPLLHHTNWVHDQVRKWHEFQMLQKMERNVLWFVECSCVTMESAVFMGKNYLNNCQSIANTTDLTLKQMFDISARLVAEQDEISWLETMLGKSFMEILVIGDERVINLQRTKVYVFSDSVLCLGKILENTQSHDAWEQRLGWLKSSQNYRNFDRVDGEPMEFEWNIFLGYNTLQLDEEVKSLLLRVDETPENVTGRIIFM